MVLSLITGTIAGLGAILFRLMIKWVASGFSVWHPVGRTHYLIALVPAVGLLLVGFISTYLAKEVKGHGVPQILEALAIRGGRIRPRVGVFGVLAPALTIGSGGSVGREGPIALIGAAFGSTLGQTLKLPDKFISLLVACGAAGGIAATFNAPIAGAFFGLEVVLGSYAMGAIVPVFISALTAVSVFTKIDGNALALAIPTLGLHSSLEIVFIFGLGIVGGLMGVAYTRGLYFSEDLFGNWSVPWWVKNVAGGLGVGVIGLFIPQILGVGYPTMHLAALGAMTLGGFFILLLAKYVATLVTIGAGGSGGVFAPSLYLGAMLGGVYGSVMHLLFPGIAANPAIYATVGMASVFAGAAQAPFVAITILLEMTGDYRLTVAVMAAAILSYIVYGSLNRDSMYTVKLTRKGIAILRGTDVRPTERITVGSTLHRPVESIRGETTLSEAFEALSASSAEVLPVLDAKNTFRGIVTLANLRVAVSEGTSDQPIASLITLVPTIWDEDSLDLAMRRLGVYDIPALGVLSRSTGEFRGLLRREDLLKTYNAQVLHSLDLEKRARELSTSISEEGLFREFLVTENSPWVGRTLSEIEWPSEVTVVSIHRAREILVPHGTSRLLPGDRLLVFGYPAQAVEDLKKKLNPVVLPGKSN